MSLHGPITPHRLPVCGMVYTFVVAVVAERLSVVVAVVAERLSARQLIVQKSQLAYIYLYYT